MVKSLCIEDCYFTVFIFYQCILDGEVAFMLHTSIFFYKINIVILLIMLFNASHCQGIGTWKQTPYNYDSEAL